MSYLLPTQTFAFVGPTEIMLAALIALVLIFGSRAPEMAEQAGEAIGNFETSREKVEKQVTNEVQDVRDEVGLDEDIEVIQEDIQTINEDLEETMNPSDPDDTETEPITEEDSVKK